MPLNRPTAPELLKAVGDYLTRPAEDPRVDRFMRRVAANMLGIVERQWSLQAEFEDTEQQSLKDLLNGLGAETDADANAALCRRLEQGIEGDDLKATVATLKRIAEAKLAIDHPGYGREK